MAIYLTTIKGPYGEIESEAVIFLSEIKCSDTGATFFRVSLSILERLNRLEKFFASSDAAEKYIRETYPDAKQL